MSKQEKAETSFDQFAAIDIRVGTVCSANVFEQARQPAYKIEVDFGADIGVLKTSAQLTHRYLPEDLIGKQIVGIVNFPKKQIANFMSEFLILGAVQGKDVILIQPQEQAPNGTSIG